MSQTAAAATGDDRIELGEMAGSIGFLLRIAQVQVFEEFYEALSAHDMKPGEFTVLWVIHLNPGLRQGTIARALRIKPAHMTKLVARLADAGYVSRITPADDRRSVRLMLTSSGKAFVRKNRDELINFHKAERSRLDDDEFVQFAALLRKFTGIPEARP